MEIDTKKTLSQLEGKKWQNDVPCEDDSYVMRKSHELYNKPLSTFDTEDLRFMIGQEIGIKYLVPLALRVLERNAFLEGDYFEGDLLKNVLEVSSDYWRNNPEKKNEIERIFINNQNGLENLEISRKIKNDINNAFEKILDM